jgi:putative Mn2+ efflux pump MntP
VLALLLLAVALGLSNFAAAIGIGVSGVQGRARVRIAVVFGVFEAGVPILGVALGQGLATSLGQATRWLGGGILIVIGVISLISALRGSRGLRDSRDQARDREPGAGQSWGWGRVVASGLALSADNLAAGFALGAYHVGLAAAAAVFGGVSVIMSLAGLELGARLGAGASERCELIASVMLIAVGAAVAAGVF